MQTNVQLSKLCKQIYSYCAKQTTVTLVSCKQWYVLFSIRASHASKSFFNSESVFQIFETNYFLMLQPVRICRPVNRVSEHFRSRNPRNVSGRFRCRTKTVHESLLTGTVERGA